jgi:chromosome segregation protein
MKLAFAEIAGFRGFRDKARFDFPGGFSVITGRNGAGKSTILDAIDFALTGTINKFMTRSARGGGLDDHIWWVGTGKPDENYVTIGFTDEQDNELTITRRRDGTLSADHEQVLSRLCLNNDASHISADTLMRTTLIRDEFIVALSVDQSEQARFEAVKAALGGLTGPDFTKRITDIQRAANEARSAQNARFESAQAELGRTLTALTEARSAAERSPDVSEALRTIDSLKINLPSNPQERTDRLQRLVADRRMALNELDQARQKAQRLQGDLSYARSPTTLARLEALRADLAAALHDQAQTEDRVSLALQAERSERELDAFVAHYASLLEHGSAVGLQDGHCPLCDALRSTEEFNSAIVSARARLAERGQRLAIAAAAVRDSTAVRDAAVAKVAAVRSALTQLELRCNVAEQGLQEIQEAYQRHSFDAPAENPEKAHKLLLVEQEKLAGLERALFILSASNAIDRVSSLEVRSKALRDSSDAEALKLAEAERAVEIAHQIETSAKTVANQILTEQFDTVMPLLKELYRRLRPHQEWTEIESDFGGKVRGSLNFTVGDGHNVQFLFSSGQRRAAGLAFLLAIHLSRRWCNWHSLLLDDPVQHIDDYRALNLVEVLAAIRRTGRQIIVAVEDASLADVLCRRLRSSTREIGRRFELHTSKTGTSEIASARDIYPMPREVLRPARVS